MDELKHPRNTPFSTPRHVLTHPPRTKLITFLRSFSGQYHQTIHGSTDISVAYVIDLDRDRGICSMVPALGRDEQSGECGCSRDGTVSEFYKALYYRP